MDWQVKAHQGAPHFTSARQLKAGRFESKSEVIRAAMRLLEEHEKKVATLRQALVDGEASGEAVLHASAVGRTPGSPIAAVNERSSHANPIAEPVLALALAFPKVLSTLLPLADFHVTRPSLTVQSAVDRTISKGAKQSSWLRPRLTV